MGTSQSERLDGDSVATLCNSTMNASFGGYSRVKPYTAWRAVLRSSVSNSAYFLSPPDKGLRAHHLDPRPPLRASSGP